MIDLIKQRERVGAVRIHGQREYRVAARRCRQRVAGHLIGHGHAVRRQRRQARDVARQAIAQRSVRTRLEQADDAAIDDSSFPGNVIRTTCDAAGYAVLVDGPADLGFGNPRRIVVIGDRYSTGGRITVCIGNGDRQHEHQVIFFAARRMQDRRVLLDTILAGRLVEGDRADRDSVLLQERDARATRDQHEAGRRRRQCEREGIWRIAAEVRDRGQEAGNVDGIGTIASAAGKAGRKRVVVDQDVDIAKVDRLFIDRIEDFLRLGRDIVVFGWRDEVAERHTRIQRGRRKREVAA